MAFVYLRQILSGKMTLEDVPTRWRSQVEALLNTIDSESSVEN